MTSIHGSYEKVAVSFDAADGTIWIRARSPEEVYVAITNALTLTRPQLLELREVVDQALSAQAPDEPDPDDMLDEKGEPLGYAELAGGY